MVTRWESDREPTFDMVLVLERAMRLPKGSIFEAAGLVRSNGTSVAHALRADPTLDDRGRRAVLAVYREVRKARRR